MEKKDGRPTDESIDLIKYMVSESLEELDVVEQDIENLQRKKSSLKRDIMDLKEGRLDRIEERHNIDVESKMHSRFTVVKKVEINAKENSPWYIPYIVTFARTTENYALPPREPCINNSITKIHASGVYKLKNGKIKNL